MKRKLAEFLSVVVAILPVLTSIVEAVSPGCALGVIMAKAQFRRELEEREFADNAVVRIYPWGTLSCSCGRYTDYRECLHLTEVRLQLEKEDRDKPNRVPDTITVDGDGGGFTIDPVGVGPVVFEPAAIEPARFGVRKIRSDE